MKYLTLLLAAILIPVVASSQAYRIDREATLIRWEGANLLRTHYGTLKVSGGELVYKAGVPAAAKVVVDMNSLKNIDLEDENRRARLENHLKSDDFFGTEKYPESSFTLVTSEKNNGTFHINGKLTIKGITHPVEFISSLSEDDNELVFTGHIEFDRSLYDVRYGSGKFFDDLGDRAINDVIKLEFELHLVK